MNVFSHLLLFCSMIYLVMGIVMLRYDKKSALNRVFFALNLSLFVWSFFIAVSTVSPDKASSLLWSTVGSLGYYTFASISIHFFLLYAKKDNLLKKWWIYLILYLPAAVFLFQAIKNNLFISDLIYSQYGWIPIYNVTSIWFWSFFGSIGLSGILNIFICFSVLKKAGSIRERKQAQIILAAASISFVAGMGYNIFAQIIIKAHIPDITVAWLMIWLLGILYAVVKYRLMILSPSLAAESILKTMIDSLVLVNPQGLISYANSETLSLLGYKRTDLLEKPFETLFPMKVKAEMQDLIKTLQHSSVRNKDTFFLSKDNTQIPILFSASICKDNYGDYLGFVALSRDITEYKQREEEIKFLSYHDQLTGLYNRRFYEEELKRLDTKRNFPISIMMGDVNGLKIVNDSIGHAKGDELIKKVARAMKKACRADDIIARLGGDEFVMLLPKTDVAHAEKIVARINKLLTKEKVDNLDITVSFGCAAKRNEAEDIQDTVKDAEDKMYQFKQLNSSRRNTIDLIMNALFAKNHREMLHSKRVGELCEAIALNMDFSKEVVNKIKIAGLMHDIGKIGIDDRTLNKTGELDPDEWEEMKKHPEMGQRILSAVTELSEIGDYIFEHQEKWDGTGYPKGLKGKEILIPARIISVADAYDAMTTPRSYRKALSEEAAIKEIKRCAGRQFDPVIARIFIEKVLRKPWE